mgnify:CR=1 FL=1
MTDDETVAGLRTDLAQYQARIIYPNIPYRLLDIAGKLLEIAEANNRRIAALEQSINKAREIFTTLITGLNSEDGNPDVC